MTTTALDTFELELESRAGESIYDLCRQLFPICRSLTGEGVRKTLGILKGILPDLKIRSVPSGERCFDWEVPPEWNIRDAFIIDPSGNKIVEFQTSNLHVVGYSIPVDREIELDELQQHLYSLPDQPDVIPYVTSYYQPRWGFCLTHRQRESLAPGRYRVVIDSTLQPGELNYGELLIPGETEQEVFLSTYVCHPSMANNELSGPALTTALGNWLGRRSRRLSYRLVFVPETIGSIVYLSQHLQEMKRRVVAGYVVTCVGDNRDYSFLPSRNGQTLADQAALHVLEHTCPDFKRYSYLDRGSDERQYCSPGVDLPVASIMRSKYGEYPEYHTSADNLDLISPQGLQGAFDVYRRVLECLESNQTPKVTVCCEPQLGKRGLYPTTSTRDTKRMVADMMNLLAYSDGTKSLLQIAQTIGAPIENLVPIAHRLKDEGLLVTVDAQSN